MEVAVPLTWEPSPPPHRPVVGRFGGGSTCRRRRPPERGAGKRWVVKLQNPHHEHNAIFRVECVCDPPELHPEFRMLPNSSVIQADSAQAAPRPVRVDVERRAAGNPERATASRWTHLGIASARWACVSRTLLRRRSPLRVAWWANRAVVDRHPPPWGRTRSRGNWPKQAAPISHNPPLI